MGNKVSHPLDNVSEGDYIVHSRAGGVRENRMEVLEIDEGRVLAFACQSKNDQLYIVNLREVGPNPIGTVVKAECSCSEFLGASAETRRWLAHGTQ